MTTPRRANTSRPGVSFLEALFATLMLAMVAATLAGVSGALRRQAERQKQWLGAAEMASRLLIIAADDESMLPSPNLPVEYGGFRYRWRFTERGVKIVPSETSVRAAEANGGAGQTMSLDRRLKVFTVQAWLSEASGGAFAPGPGVPQVTLSRLHDPLALENPDQAARQVARDMEGLFSDILGAASGEAGSDEERVIGGEQQPAGGGAP